MATVDKYQTKSGTKYRVRYRTPDGRQTDKRGFDTKRDADAFAATVEVAKLRGAYVAPKLGKKTVSELGPPWLERQRGLLKPSTFRTYENHWRNHVEPRWGDTRIADIHFTDVQAWVGELAGRRSAGMVANIHMVLAQILDDAVIDKLLSVNPARNAKFKLPARPPRRNVYLTAQQLHRLAEESGRYRSLILTLGVAGCRWGEAAALRVRDVKFLQRKIELHRNAVTVGRQVVVGTLKSNKNRTLAVPEFLIDAIAETAQGKSLDDLLWPRDSGGYSSPPNTSGSWLCAAVARCQKADAEFPRVTAHDLRHTAASLAISAGANPKLVQRMLGHESAAMTLDVYADLFDTDMVSVAENVGKMWAREVQANPHTAHLRG